MMNGENKTYSPFLPSVVMWLAVLGWFGFQASQSIKERYDLGTLKASQEATYQNAQKMRTQLDAIATGTQKLADGGNPNAGEIVAGLRARGITIRPEAVGK